MRRQRIICSEPGRVTVVVTERSLYTAGRGGQKIGQCGRRNVSADPGGKTGPRATLRTVGSAVFACPSGLASVPRGAAPSFKEQERNVNTGIRSPG